MADEQEFARASRPLARVVLCFTSIVHDVRSDLCNKAAEMGAIWKQDLTSDATHLIVGDSDTPKYKYVARQRPDVKAMSAGFIDAVRELWIKGDDVPLSALEEEHKFPALTGFRICGTNLTEDERKKLSALVSDHGATYNGDLTKSITHLIAATAKGKKYDFAKQWGIKIVSPEWVYESVQRGMALEEQFYDPTLPEEERGKNAWVRPNIKKRKSTLPDDATTDVTRQAAVDPGKRKIRKTASEKLSAQSTSIWGDIIGQAQAPKAAKRDEWEEGDSFVQADEIVGIGRPESPKPDAGLSSTTERASHTGSGAASAGAGTNSTTMLPSVVTTSISSGGMFADMGFYIHNFDSEKTLVLRSTVQSFDGESYSSLPALLGARVSRYFIVVPASMPASECPKVSDSSRAVQIATFWWIEKCMHMKQFVDPDDYPLLRPFRTMPIPELDKLSISISLFSDIDLLHMSRVIKEAGAKWHDEFTRKTSVLVVNSKRLSQKRDKMEAAFEWGIPVVTDIWLLGCLSEGQRLDFEKYRLTADGDVWPAGNGGKKGSNDVAQVNGRTTGGALSQCVICVSSKLKEHQAKLHSIAASMDAKLVDSLSSRPSPTHLLHLSKTSRDTSADYKAAAKLPGCHIVSPQWLTSCKKAERRLNESDFPAFSIPESNKSTANSRLSASPQPENPADFDESGPFIVEDNEEPESAPNVAALPKKTKTATPTAKQPDKAGPSPFISEKSSKRTLRGRLESATSEQDQPEPIGSPKDAGSEPLVPLPSFKQPPTRNQSGLAPSIMENLSELLKMQQQASANKPTSTTSKGKRLRGRLQGRALSNNSLPPQNAATAMSRASSTHSSLSVEDASGSLERRASASTGSINHNNNLEEYSALDDMDPNGVLGSQAIHYVDPEAQMEKRKMLEKLGVTSGSETDNMLKGRTLSVMTMAAEGLNIRRRTTRSGAK